MRTQDKADFLREDVMRVACKNGKGHIAPSLSCVDILTVLFYQVAQPYDTIILSKGHGCYCLYAIYADRGVISRGDWENFNLPGCLDGFGSLGHGLPIAVGVGFGNMLLGRRGRVWCIVGDGEMQEGSNWEALSFLNHHDLKNVTVIVDNNGLQAMDATDKVLSQDLKNRFIGWGLYPHCVDGHDHGELIYTLNLCPTVVIASTVKGKGFKHLENNPRFHYRVPNDNERERS